MRRTKALLAGFLAGIASPLNLFEPRKYNRLKGDDLSRMRGDVERVGGDFARAIGKYEKKNNPTQRARGAYSR